MQKHGIQLGADIEQLNAIYQVFKGIVKASRNYHARESDVDMLVIRARHGSVSEFSNHPFPQSVDWGWREFTKGQICGHFLDGSHYTLLESPAVTDVHRKIEYWLSRERQTIVETCPAGVA